MICSSDYAWKLDTDCTSEGLTCVALDPQKRACGECSPAGSAGELSCLFTRFVSCSAEGFWKEQGDCSDAASNGVCVGKGNCRVLGEICGSGSTAMGCLDPNKGWWCDTKGDAITGECDCSDGIACKQ
jgi:hypothetical protein